MLTQAQVDLKKTSLGGSEIAAALGLSRWKTPLQLWAEKTGQIDAEDISDKLQVRLGNKLEGAVAELFQEETGKKLHRVNETMSHPKHKFLVGHLDRRVVGEKSIVELKTASPMKIKEWGGDEVPAEYLIQTVYYMNLFGAEKGYLACLFGNMNFLIKEIPKNPELESDIIKKASEFWNSFVIPKLMPAVTSEDAETLYRLFPMGDSGSSVELGSGVELILEERKNLMEKSNEINEKIKTIENQIKVLMKDSETGKAGRFSVKWSNVKTKAYQVSEKEYRTFRVTEKKNGNNNAN